MSAVRARVRVHGRVQGVSFRDTLRRAAERRGVHGYARNMPDGSVEAAFEGSPNAVAALVALAHVGPPAALVERADVAYEEPQGARGFSCG